MGAYQDFFTRNPQIRVDILNNPALTAEFQRRTLNFKLIDNDMRYDEIEWELDNRDGLLTRPEFMALGYILRVRVGYNAYTTAWRAFVITRLKGGVGVTQASSSGGMAESVITLSGRNRNAPDIRPKRRSKKTQQSPTPTGRGVNGKTSKKQGAPTRDITRLETITRKDPLYEDTLDPKRKRVFNVRQTSDAVREVFRLLGYTDSHIQLEDSNDNRTQVIIPEGVSAGDWVQEQANELGWIYKHHRGMMKFHSPNWVKSRPLVVETFTYGAPDVLELTIDGDFRLPVPGKVKAHSYNPVYRRHTVHEELIANNPNTNKTYDIFLRDDAAGNYMGFEGRKQILQQDMSYLEPGAGLLKASAKAQKHFRNRHLRALKISLTITGNPNVLATDYVRIKATGNPIIDGVWYVEQAEHDFEGSGSYITRINLLSTGRNKKTMKRYVRLTANEKLVNKTNSFNLNFELDSAAYRDVLTQPKDQ